jgi:hypothetical protein
VEGCVLLRTSDAELEGDAATSEGGDWLKPGTGEVVAEAAGDDERCALVGGEFWSTTLDGSEWEFSHT